ncbi:MAG: hypothetical protein BSOLF_0534 [Candidatus Carbobacillus altaicus]|uniref:Uncharacterized protein n=1 Tax=Candidatus Carbonibacillus altaicus TaxID=2163959 RepID=A0A2R6Y0Q6_9BACL|nr:MAG: hypothetical protein BSOLF_0534 [Candidatus Carbobacillus altaicus]
MKIYVSTYQESLKNRLSARLVVQERPEDADLILVYEDAMGTLEDLAFGDKPVLFLHSGKTPGIPEKAYRLGIPENYILDASTLRFSEFRKTVEDVIQNPLLADPYLLLVEGDEILFRGEAAQTHMPYDLTQKHLDKHIPDWIEVLQNYPGHIIYVTGLRGGVGVSSFAAGLYHHYKVQGVPVLLFSPKEQSIYNLFFDESDHIYTRILPDELPSTVIVDLPYDIRAEFNLPRGENILVVESTYYDLKLFQEGTGLESGILIINKTRDDLSSTGVNRFFVNIQTMFRAFTVRFMPEEMDAALKEGITPDRSEPFVDAFAELVEHISAGVM